MGKLSKPNSYSNDPAGLKVVVQPRGRPGSIVSTVGRGGANVTLSTDGVLLNDDKRPVPVVHQYDRQFSLGPCNANDNFRGPSCALERIAPTLPRS